MVNYNYVISFSSETKLNIGSYEKCKGGVLCDGAEMPSIKKDAPPAGYNGGVQTSGRLDGTPLFSVNDRNPDFTKAFQNAIEDNMNVDTIHVFEVYTWTGKDNKEHTIVSRQLTFYKAAIQGEAQKNSPGVFQFTITALYAEHKRFAKAKDAGSFSVEGNPMYLDIIKDHLLDKLPDDQCKPSAAAEIKSGA